MTDTVSVNSTKSAPIRGRMGVLSPSGGLSVDSSQVERFSAFVLKNWVNQYLAKRSLQINDLAQDFRSGYMLVVLLEILSGKNVSRNAKESKDRAQRLRTVSLALTFMKHENIKLVNVRASEIVDGNLTLILGLIFKLVLRYDVSPVRKGHGARHEKEAFMQGRADLLSFVQEQVPDEKITNFVSDWQSGIALWKLTASLDPSMLNGPMPDSPLECLSVVMKIAEEKHHVARVIEPDMILSPFCDETSMMTYLSGFLKAAPRTSLNAPLSPAPPKIQIRKPLPSPSASSKETRTKVTVRPLGTKPPSSPRLAGKGSSRPDPSRPISKLTGSGQDASNPFAVPDDGSDGVDATQEDGGYVDEDYDYEEGELEGDYDGPLSRTESWSSNQYNEDEDLDLIISSPSNPLTKTSSEDPLGHGSLGRPFGDYISNPELSNSLGSDHNEMGTAGESGEDSFRLPKFDKNVVMNIKSTKLSSNNLSSVLGKDAKRTYIQGENGSSQDDAAPHLASALPDQTDPKTTLAVPPVNRSAQKRRQQQKGGIEQSDPDNLDMELQGVSPPDEELVGDSADVSSLDQTQTVQSRKISSSSSSSPPKTSDAFPSETLSQPSQPLITRRSSELPVQGVLESDFSQNVFQHSPPLQNETGSSTSLRSSGPSLLPKSSSSSPPKDPSLSTDLAHSEPDLVSSQTQTHMRSDVASDEGSTQSNASKASPRTPRTQRINFPAPPPYASIIDARVVGTPSRSPFKLKTDATICKACSRPFVKGERVITTSGSMYHCTAECFKCCMCEQFLGNQNHIVQENDQLYCVHDYKQIGHKCARCKGVIVFREIVVDQLDARFHRKCYSCWTCYQPFEDDVPGKEAYPVNGKLYCYDHAVKEKYAQTNVAMV